MQKAKPIEPGCTVIVVAGEATGTVCTALTRKWGEGYDVFTLKRREGWGWATDPKPSDRAFGYQEEILMRIDDPDIQDEIKRETDVPKHEHV